MAEKLGVYDTTPHMSGWACNHLPVLAVELAKSCSCMRACQIRYCWLKASLAKLFFTKFHDTSLAHWNTRRRQMLSLDMAEQKMLALTKETTSRAVKCLRCTEVEPRDGYGQKAAPRDRQAGQSESERFPMNSVPIGPVHVCNFLLSLFGIISRWWGDKRREKDRHVRCSENS